MGQLEQILSAEVRQRAILSGSELVLPHSDALRAIRVAGESQIAVLGVEVFGIRRDGILTVGCSGYDSAFPKGGNWTSYYKAMNAEAEKWINSNRFEENHGYILTSTSESEFVELEKTVDGWKRKKSFLGSIIARFLR